MLPVAVHEQHRAEAGVVEAREQRGLLAEVAGQRNDLDVEIRGRQGRLTVRAVKKVSELTALS